MEEEYKEIPGYDGAYQASNLGNIKSFKGLSKEGRILKPGLSGDKGRGYLAVGLLKDGKKKTIKVHQLVAITFLNHKPDGTQKIVVDHINNDRLDNRLENLQLISQRHNSSKDKKGGTSKYTGVSWDKPSNKWRASIRIDGKIKYLGLFDDEQEAALAYKKSRAKMMEESDKYYEDNYGNKNIKE